jgi:cobaltochelatase CobS
MENIIIDLTKEKNVTQDGFPSSVRHVDAGVEFGLKELKGVCLDVPVFDKSSQYLSVPKDDYVFNPEQLRNILSFLGRSSDDALYLYGPSGCGKTSMIMQTAAVLKWPVVSLTINGRFELADLIGHPTIVKNELVFVHGALARAMKYGYILILNEIDVADAAELSGLNDVLEGRNLVVIQNNGEVIKPHPCFRLVVTANTCGRGSKGTYHGTQLLNAAFLDRFRFIGCDYMSHKEELELLRKVVNMDDKVLSDMVKVASEIRKSHLDPKPNHVYMSVPMSTRALVRWAKLASEYSSYESSPVAVALVHAFSGRLSEEERCYVTRLASDIMAEEAEINTSSD